MKRSEIQSIQSELQKHLSAKRYAHTISVAYLASSLAMCYQYNVEQFFLAGLLHDCAKYMDDEEFFSYCKKKHIVLTKLQMQNTFSLHAIVGRYIAEEKYNIEDSSILNAIYYHTTGRPNMSPIEKVIFAADYLEQYRTHDENLKELRALAFHNLDLCIEKIYKHTLDYLYTQDNPIDSLSVDAYQYYKQLNTRGE